jgi:hypothetical protein
MQRGTVEEISGLERLLALEDIRTLKARRDRAVDTKDWVLLESLHAPDHTSYNADYPPWTTAAEMIANVQVIMEHLKTAHHSHTPEITLEAPDRASGIWAMSGLSVWNQGEKEHWFLGMGHYYETYDKIQGGWLFTSRRLQSLFTQRSAGAIFPPRGAL